MTSLRQQNEPRLESAPVQLQYAKSDWHRSLRWSMGLALGCLALSLALLALSTRYGVGYVRRDYKREPARLSTFLFEQGNIGYHRMEGDRLVIREYAGEPKMGLLTWSHSFEFRFLWPGVETRVQKDRYGGTASASFQLIIIPIWLPIASCGIVAIVVWVGGRRRGCIARNGTEKGIRDKA